MRLVFAGTPQVAVPALDAVLKSRHEVVAVVTRPDAPAGRGLHLVPSPVAQRAAEAGIEVLRPRRPREEDFLARLREIAPDCCPVTAYGALLPQAALDIPVHGWVNLHFSLLPAWRGAAPVQHSILHGDDITGATTFRIVADLDAGPVFGVLTEHVRPTDTAGDLLGRLAVCGAELLVATLDGIESGQLEARPQPPEGITLAPKVSAGDARVRWGTPAAAVDRQIRACTPAPGAWTGFGDARLKLWPLAVPPAMPPAPLAVPPAVPGAPRPVPPADPAARLAPGELRVLKSAVLVGTATTPVQLGDVQPPGKRRMSATEWARGLRLGAGGAGQEPVVLA